MENKKDVKRILAMDLSLSLPAYAIIDIVKGKALVREIRHTDNKSGKLPKLSHAERLDRIAKDIVKIFADYPDIDAVVREKGFSRYANTTQILFRVVGVSDLKVFEASGITNIDEIAPTSVKRLVAGDGKASKQEVEEGVREHLVDLQKNIEFFSDDESDAVAVGIAWMIKNGYLI
ncbi:TPA: crossover junction endodeoxyribonuclease RuvC [Clostridium botulinum]|uniref:crossover junction endodeoxyribonuclease RuvC n=1 Tax=Clostridium botulinum TaxID=1491 RepID=UPI001C9B7ADC|nr:crossover junction endodeoxyribonuclease RuvC [Clostridium botulinum]MBY6909561.1 crossover junction endodeoxyribonuclease RuvC [Clostridium botulinum]